MLESLAAFMLPSLGFEPIKPFRLTPVYFPGWIIDAEVKGEVNYKGDEVCLVLFLSLYYLTRVFPP
jgi:hypothetical protein